MSKFPDEIYIQHNNPAEPDSDYLHLSETALEAATASLDGGKAGEAVGVYKLHRIVRIEHKEEAIEHSL